MAQHARHERLEIAFRHAPHGRIVNGGHRVSLLHHSAYAVSSRAVVAVLDRAALAEERVRLVEHQRHPQPLRRVEQRAQGLLRLPDVLANGLRTC